MMWLWLAVAVWVASSLLCLVVGRAFGRARERREAAAVPCRVVVGDFARWQREIGADA